MLVNCYNHLLKSGNKRENMLFDRALPKLDIVFTEEGGRGEGVVTPL